MDARALPGRLIRARPFQLFLGITILLAFAIFLRRELAALQQYAWRFSPVAVAAGAVWGALYFGGLAVCWALLLRGMGADTAHVPAQNGARVWLLSMSTRYLPGNVWHILSRVALSASLEVAPSRVLASAVVEQVLTLLGALAVWGITLPFWGVARAAQTELLLLLPVGLALLHPRILGALLAWVARRLHKPALAWRYSYGQILRLLFAYAAAMICAGVALWTTLWGLTGALPDQVLLLLGAAALAWSAGFLSFFTPSGLGVREAVLVALLAQVYPLPVAIAASLVFRLVLTAGEALAVALVWMAGRWTKERPWQA